MNDFTGKPAAYLAYLLRLWEAGTRGSQSIWRASLEDAHSGERLAFGSVEALFAFLAEKTCPLNAAEDVPQSPRAADAHQEQPSL
jgi:hypothetical protein